MKLQAIITIDTGDDPVWAITEMSAAEVLALLQNDYTSFAAFLADALIPPTRWSVAVVVGLGDDKAVSQPAEPWSNDPTLMTTSLGVPSKNFLRIVE